MKKVFLTVLILALAAGFPSAARADFEDGQLIPAQIVAPLMAWVQQQTGVRVPTLPRVEASRTKLLKIAGRTGQVAGRARAIYTGGTIVLDHYLFAADDATQLSFLVHELVHYAQSFRTVPTGTCSRAKEFEAYTLQNKWLEAHGHAPIVSASWINRMASCPAPTTLALAQTR